MKISNSNIRKTFRHLSGSPVGRFEDYVLTRCGLKDLFDRYIEEVRKTGTYVLIRKDTYITDSCEEFLSFFCEGSKPVFTNNGVDHACKIPYSIVPLFSNDERYMYTYYLLSKPPVCNEVLNGARSVVSEEDLRDIYHEFGVSHIDDFVSKFILEDLGIINKEVMSYINSYESDKYCVYRTSLRSGKISYLCSKESLFFSSHKEKAVLFDKKNIPYLKNTSSCKYNSRLLFDIDLFNEFLDKVKFL